MRLYPEEKIFSLRPKDKKQSITKAWRLVKKYSEEYLSLFLKESSLRDEDEDKILVESYKLACKRGNDQGKLDFILKHWNFGRDINDGKVWIETKLVKIA